MKKSILTLFTLMLCCMACKNKSSLPQAPAKDTETKMSEVAFNADSAYQYVVRQCDFGPRTPGSDAHKQCGDYIASVFKSFGLEVQEQTATLTNWDGVPYTCRNLIASHLPEADRRILLCAHWDCRPWCDADADPANHRKPVMGANDGASGVAVMMELARQIGKISPNTGIDFICFDLEDYGAPYWAEDKAPYDGSDWCLGSRYWATNPHKENYTASFGILLDMVGGEHTQFRYEGYSLQYARDIVVKVWQTAANLGYDNYFRATDGGWATDDHVPINEYAGIPTIDIIPHVEDENSSFGPTWHTVNDTPEHISRQTLKAVGQTLVQVLHEQNQ